LSRAATAALRGSCFAKDSLPIRRTDRAPGTKE
jgi:hypothetical protein